MTVNDIAKIAHGVVRASDGCGESWDEADCAQKQGYIYRLWNIH